jgi:hypothetical protein
MRSHVIDYCHRQSFCSCYVAAPRGNGKGTSRNRSGYWQSPTSGFRRPRSATLRYFQPICTQVNAQVQSTVNAVVKETFRWAVPVPLGETETVCCHIFFVLTTLQGLPHALREDDVYEGMFIPKGTLVRRH